MGLLASLVLVAPFASSPAAAQTGCGRVNGNWTSVAGPSFPSGGAGITAFAVSPTDPDQMYVTNGSVVMRSSSEGCNWAPSLEAAAGGGLPAAAASAEITAIQVPAAASKRAYVAIQETVGPAARSRVMRTDDAGGSWQEAGAGLPPTGAPALLRVAPGAPDTVYLAISVQGVIELLYGSDDGGASWTPRSNFSRSIAAGVTDVQVDPLNPAEVWAGAVDGLYHSTDGGRTFTPVPEFAGGPAGPIDVAHERGKPASIMAFRSGVGGALLSDDGGQTWLQVASPGNPTSVSHGAIPQFRMISSVGRVWVYTPTLFNWVDARAPARDVGGLTGALTLNPAFYGHTSSTIEIYRGPVGTSVRLPGGELILPDRSLLDPGTAPPERSATLSPRERVIKIDAGDSKTVPYRLLVPKSRTPLDVYFVIDTSSSQRRFIVQMAEALETIINQLVSSGTDVQLGLAEYRNYPDASPPRLGPPGSGAMFYEPNFVYRQRQPIAPTTAGIEEALESIEPDGGGHYNAQLEALYQTATGEGYDAEPVGPAGNDVPPGLSADFRRSALKVAVLVSDEEFIERPLDNDRTPPDLRTFEESAAALSESNIKQVGLSLSYKGAAPATADMQEMARRTGATAPGAGVDCDGDGSADVADGQPLVCTLSREKLGEDTALASAIVNLVESIRTRESVSLAVAGRDEVTQKVTPDLYESVVLQSSNSLTFDVTFRCPMSLAGKSFPIKLTARGIDPRVSSTATVKCRSVAESDEPLPIPFERVLGVIPLLPLSPPPPITELASSTQAQAQSQAQAQAQASMAAQRQQQPQLAFVHAVHAMRQQAQEEYAMSSFRAPMEVPATALALGGATVLMSLAFGLAMSRQRARPATRSARRRRR